MSPNDPHEWVPFVGRAGVITAWKCPWCLARRWLFRDADADASFAKYGPDMETATRTRLPCLPSRVTADKGSR